MLGKNLSEKQWALGQLAVHLSASKHWAIKSGIDQSVISEIDHLQNVVEANQEEAEK